MAMNLVRLGKIFDPSYEVLADTLFSSVASDVQRNPTGYTYLLCALDYFFGPSSEVVVVGDHINSVRILNDLQRKFLPNSLLFFKNEGLQRVLDYTSNMKNVGDQPAIYICRNRSCGLPITNVQEALQQLLHLDNQGP